MEDRRLNRAEPMLRPLVGRILLLRSDHDRIGPGITVATWSVSSQRTTYGGEPSDERTSIINLGGPVDLSSRL